MRGLLAYLLLALSLAGAGPAAYAHSLSHLSKARVAHHQLDGGQQENGHACELCAAFSGVGALGTAPALPGVASASAPVALPPLLERLIPCEALERFASRAPPLPA